MADVYVVKELSCGYLETSHNKRDYVHLYTMVPLMAMSAIWSNSSKPSRRSKDDALHMLLDNLKHNSAAHSAVSAVQVS